MSEETTEVAEIPSAPTVEKKTDIKEYIRDIVPYTEEQGKRIAAFYSMKGKIPGLFRYNNAGNLVVYNKDNALQDTITLKTFVPLDPAQRETLHQERMDAVGEAQSRYQTALDALRTAMNAHKQTGAMQAVLAAQKAVKEADQILTRVRYGTRAIQNVPNPEIRQINFDRLSETKKMFPMSGDPFKKQLVRLIVRELPPMKFYGTYVETSPETDEDVTKQLEENIDDTSVRQKLRDGRMARIFYEAAEGVSGFLSPFWPVEFTMENSDGTTIRFFTASQAWEYTRAKEAGLENMVSNILQTRSTRSMRYVTKKLQSQPKDPKGTWLRILTALYEQHEELKTRLLETGTDALVFADEREGPSGIGLGERARESLDPSKWKGENAMGTALETLRYQLREGGTEGLGTAVSENGETDMSVITEEQQAAQRAGAIIAVQRKKFFKKGGGGS
jgi:predicted NAD-dependent protein-ADP-ribosyltransferase YbiA (DUF1768 family)